MNIGVLGTGVVGSAIASRLVGLGHEVKMGAREVGDETARLNGRTLKVAVEGVTPAWGRIRNSVPEEGRYLAEQDIETRATVACCESSVGRLSTSLTSAVSARLAGPSCM